jgi:hypothetical protein
LLILPLALSAFTHLWNPIGFPSFYVDEGHYMRRTAQVLEGLGSQESATGYNENRQYDHPYFGQLFIAAALQLTNYPDAQVTDPTGNVESIERLYMVPRILMGVLAVIDTFLIYKICERRYNRNIALIASILFAVMPMSWFVRRILLESIQLPFILLSVLFATYYRSSSLDEKEKDTGVTDTVVTRNGNSYNTMRVIISGISLGIAIFTKIPAVAIIPVIAFLILTGNNKNVKTLGLWFIPVILIPSIWPAYSILTVEFNEWMEDITWQSQRTFRALSASLDWDLKIDPVLFLLGIAGIIYALIKRDPFPVVWSVPFLFFLDYVGYAQFFHITPLIPIFCISGAILIGGLPYALAGKYKKYIAKHRTSSEKDKKEKGIQETLSNYTGNNKPSRSTKPRYAGRFIKFPFNNLQFVIIAGIGMFGLVSTTMLTTMNLNSTYFAISSAISQQLIPNYSNNDPQNDRANEGDTNHAVVGQRNWGIYYSWIPQYVYHYDFDFLPFKDVEALHHEKVLLIIDKRLNNMILGEDDKENDGSYIEKLRSVYNDTITRSTYNDKRPYDRDVYPYTSLHQNRRIDIMELRANY